MLYAHFPIYLLDFVDGLYHVISQILPINFGCVSLLYYMRKLTVAANCLVLKIIIIA